MELTYGLPAPTYGLTGLLLAEYYLLALAGGPHLAVACAGEAFQSGLAGGRQGERDD